MCTKFYLFTIISFYYFSNSFGLDVRLLPQFDANNGLISSEEYNEDMIQRFSSDLNVVPWLHAALDEYKLNLEKEEEDKKREHEIIQILSKSLQFERPDLYKEQSENCKRAITITSSFFDSGLDIFEVLNRNLDEFLGLTKEDEENFYKIAELLTHVAISGQIIDKYAWIKLNKASFGLPFISMASDKLKFIFKVHPSFFDFKKDKDSFLKIKEICSYFDLELPSLDDLMQGYSNDDWFGMKSIEQIRKATVNFFNDFEELIVDSPLHHLERMNEFKGPLLQKLEKESNKKKQKVEKKEISKGLHCAIPVKNLYQVYCPGFNASIKSPGLTSLKKDKT